MAKLIITRGLPASGKTTWAEEWVAQDPVTRVRVNRDDIRAMLNGGEFIKGVTEDRVIKARNLLLDEYLIRGLEVVCDDTNLPQRTARELRAIADRTGAQFEVKDFTFVPVGVCVERELRRGKLGGPKEGTEIITDMYRRFLAGKLPLSVPEPSGASLFVPNPYSGTPGAEKAVIVDIDGTVALHNGRNPYDYHLCMNDLPNTHVIELVEMLHYEDYAVIFVSGRDDACYGLTWEWIREKMPFLVEYGTKDMWILHMRKTGDKRPDYIVKSEIFDARIRDRFDVRYVLDDRNSVVAMWREMGLTVLQVADGDF